MHRKPPQMTTVLQDTLCLNVPLCLDIPFPAARNNLRDKTTACIFKSPRVLSPHGLTPPVTHRVTCGAVSNLLSPSEPAEKQNSQKAPPA